MADKCYESSEIIINAVNYSKLAQNTPVINLNQLGYRLHVHLPENVIQNCELYRIDELLPEVVEDRSYTGFTNREGRKPWLDILVEWLNTSVGQHIYKLLFVDVNDDSTFALYMSYIIQEDHPKQNYVYMERE